MKFSLFWSDFRKTEEIQSKKRAQWRTEILERRTRYLCIYCWGTKHHSQESRFLSNVDLIAMMKAPFRWRQRNFRNVPIVTKMQFKQEEIHSEFLLSTEVCFFPKLLNNSTSFDSRAWQSPINSRIRFPILVKCQQRLSRTPINSNSGQLYHEQIKDTIWTRQALSSCIFIKIKLL